jgi:hypothetical protein
MSKPTRSMIPFALICRSGRLARSAFVRSRRGSGRTGARPAMANAEMSPLREALLRRIEVEYHDMPGLRLTRAQAQRLFGLREDICVRVLETLVQARILRIDPSGSFVRNGAFP